MDNILSRLIQKKERLDKYQPLSPELIKNLDDWFRVELTFTSNAIEGNTLTRRQTALIIEDNLTVEGKSLTEHLEAVNHAQALTYLKKLVNKKREQLTEADILEIHRIILAKIDDRNAGGYRTVAVRIAGSTVVMPNAVKVPTLMNKFIQWLNSPHSAHISQIAADAHYRLVSIHPFVDGNGRTARLLMNLLLLQAGYPPALIRKEDRRRYLDSVERGQLGQGLQNYYQLILEAIERSLDIYLEAVGDKLLRIGELAQKTGETIHTIRFWTKEGLLTVQNVTQGGYQLYDPAMIKRVAQIRRWQNEKRLTIAEIKAKINN
ncbi:MAG: Fic family protein [Candidatus Shapirobacteria bacterium]